MLLTGFLVLTGSLVFFTGRGESADLGLNAVLLLASYPADVFAGATKVLLYTAVPAAFVSGVPAELVDDFDVGDAALLVGILLLVSYLGTSSFSAVAARRRGPPRHEPVGEHAQAGAAAFLVGESLMRESDIGAKLRELLGEEP